MQTNSTFLSKLPKTKGFMNSKLKSEIISCRVNLFILLTFFKEVLLHIEN